MEGGEELQVTDAGDEAVDRPRDLTEVDSEVAQPARIADYLKGGQANFAVDRESVEYLTSVLPGGVDAARTIARTSRTFRAEVVRYLAVDAGVDQFLNMETDLPTENPTHEVAQAVVPASRVVYVVTEAVVLAHAHSFLRGTPEGKTAFVTSRDHDSGRILEEASGVLDLSRPTVVILAGISHRLGGEDPYEVVACLMAGVPSGSYLVATHLGDDIWVDELAEAAKRMDQLVEKGRMAAIIRRSHAEVARLFTGLELIGPGVVPVDRWRPEAAELASPPFPDATTPVYGGVARKP